jgi:predicted dithiol-disulfide oxidoreductase (DUF899 family)
MIAISRAPFEKLAAYKERMGWDFKWVSSFENDFNFDYAVSFNREESEVVHNYRLIAPPDNEEHAGVSVFYTDNGNVFHTYSTYSRGLDLLNTTYNYLDHVPKGRDEDGRGPFWVRRHDEY